MGYTSQSVTDSNIGRAVRQGENVISRALVRDRLFLLTVALLLLILALVVLFPLRAAGDVALYVDIGGRVLDGQRPYIDFFDINPPTIHFLNVLPVAISRLTGIYPILVYDIFVWALVVWIAGCTGYSLSRARDEQLLSKLQPWLIPVLIVLGSFVAWAFVSFGQRDHIFILVFMVWSILRWYRWEGGHPPAGIAVLTGALAAVGASLKPTFVLAFVLVEVYGLLRYHRWQNYFTWEIFGAGIVIALYGVYFVAQPDILSIYLTQVAPSVVAGYSGYGYIPASDLIIRDAPSVFVLGFAGLVALGRTRLRSAQGRLYVLMAMLGLGAVISFALQTKGWSYHALPIFVMILVIIGLCFDAATLHLRLQTLRRKSTFTGTLLVAIVIACTALSFVFGSIYTYGELRTEKYEPYLAYAQAGDTVIAGDMDVRAVYSAMLQADLKPVASYPIAYPLAFAYAAVDDPSAVIYEGDHIPPPIAQKYLDALMDDIRQQPRIVLLRSGRSDTGPGFMDVARYVKAHTDIESLLAREYEAHGIIAAYEIYVRRSG